MDNRLHGRQRWITKLRRNLLLPPSFSKPVGQRFTPASLMASNWFSVKSSYAWNPLRRNSLQEIGVAFKGKLFSNGVSEEPMFMLNMYEIDALDLRQSFLFPVGYIASDTVFPLSGMDWHDDAIDVETLESLDQTFAVRSDPTGHVPS